MGKSFTMKRRSDKGRNEGFWDEQSFHHEEREAHEEVLGS
jgi:hypothetical protein